MKRILSLLGGLMLLSGIAQAQTLKTGTISTAGSDCTVATRCVIVDMTNIASLGVDLDVGTSGTFQFEASMNATLNVNATTTNGTWFSATDDVGAASNATADGRFYFTNAGWKLFRIRASAINGNAQVSVARGFNGLRSTATLSGASQGDGAIVDGSNPLIKTTVLDLANSNPVTVAITNASGDQITSFGGGQEYTGAPVVAAGSLIGKAMFGYDGANARPLLTNTAGALNVIFPSAQAISASALPLPTGAATETTLAALNTKVTAVNTGAVVVSSSALPTGAATAAKQPALGTAGSSSTDVISVQGIASGTALPISGTITCSNCSGTGVSVNEDAASSNGAAGTPAYAVRQDTPATDTSADGDYTPLKSDAVGRLYVTGSGGTFPVTGSISCSNCSGTGVSVNEDVASANADPGTPAYGIRSDTLASTTSATGDYGPLKQTAVGGLWVTLADTTGAALTPSADVVEDAAAASNPSGPQMMLRRKDTLSGSEVSADGDHIAANATSKGEIYVKHTDSIPVTNAGTFVTQENGAALTALQLIDNPIGSSTGGTAGTSSALSGGIYNTSLPTLTNGQQAGIQLDSSGRQLISCSNCSGSGVSVLEDAASANGDAGTPAYSVRSDTLASTTSANGDYQPLKSTAVGSQWVTLANASGTELTPSVDVVEDAAETNGVTGPAIMSVRRDAPVTSSSASGDYSTVNTSSQGAVWTSLVADANGGATAFGLVSAASNNATNVKASAANLYNVTILNTTATLYYIRFYNLTTSPTCSSATGFYFTLPIPASTTGAGLTTNINVGLSFPTGLAFCITAGGTSTDNTSAATGLYGFLAYK